MAALDNFAKTIAAAQRWTLTSYPAAAWRDLARVISDGIKAEVDRSGWPAVREQLMRDGFARYVEAENDRLARALCGSGSDCQFDETIGAIRADGELRIIATVVNMRRVLAAVDARLRRSAAEWRYGGWTLFGRTDAADIEAAIRGALVERQATLRALLVAEAISALPPAIRGQLGVDADAIAAHFAAIGDEAGREAFALIANVDAAGDQAIREALRRTDAMREAAVDRERALVAAVRPIYAVAERLAARIERAKGALDEYLCTRDFVPLSRQRDPSGTTPYLALTRAIGEPSAPARLVLVVPRGILGESAQARMAETLSRAGLSCPNQQRWSSAVAVELGVVLPALAYDLEERAFFIRAPLGRRWEYVQRSIDEQKATLLAALARIGLPAVGPIRNVQLEIEDLFDDARRRVVISFVAVPTVPGIGEVPTPVSIDLANGAALIANACPLKRAAGQALAARLEAAFAASGRTARLNQSGAVRLADLRASGGADCGAVVRVDGALTVGALNTSVPVSLTLGDDGRLTPSGPLFAAPLKDRLRAEVVRRIDALVAAARGSVEGLGTFARVTALDVEADRLFDQGVLAARGTVTFRFGDDPPVEIAFAWGPDGLSIDPSAIATAVRERLAAGAATALAPLRQEAEELRQALGDRANAVAAALNGSEISLFGMTARLDAAREDGSRTFRVGARIELPRIGRAFAVEGLTLVAPQIEHGRVVGGAIRFAGDVRLTGGSARDLIAELTGLNPEWLVLTQEVFREDAFVADVSLRLDGVLATPIEIGTIALSARGIDAAFSEDLRQRVVSEMLARLGEAANRLLAGVDRLKPVTGVELVRCEGTAEGNCTFLHIRRGEAPRFAVWVRGSLQLEAFGRTMAVPFRARLLTESGPDLDVKIDEEGIRENVTGVLAGALSALGAGTFEVTPITTAPYGVQISFALSLSALVPEGIGLDLKVDRLRITTEGIDINGPITMRTPASFPIGPVMIVTPGIAVDLREPARIGLIGDIGLDQVTLNIVKIASSVTADFTKPTEPRILLRGDAVVGNTVPLLTATGEVTLSVMPSARLQAETAPAIRRIIDAEASFELHRANRLSGLARVAVLGLQIGTADFAFTISPGEFRARGETSIPIGTNVMFEVEGDPAVGRLRAGGGLSFDIGSFPAASVRLGLSVGRATAAVSVAGMRGKIIAPTVNAITPDLVLELLRSLFRFDPASFLEAIKKREIVINLIEPGGAPSNEQIGEGDPVDGATPPGGGAGNPPPSSPSDGATPTTVGPPQEVATGRPPPGARPAAETSGAPRATRPGGGAGGGNEEHPLVQDERGWFVEFRPFQNGPHFERVFRRRGEEWVSYELYTAAARNALRGGAGLLRSYYDVAGERGAAPCTTRDRRFALRPGAPAEWSRPIHILVAPGTGTPRLLAVEGGYEATPPYSLENFPFPFGAIGLTTQQLFARETRLLPGDYAVLDLAALTAVSCDFGGVPKVTLLNFGGPGENDVYLVERTANTGAEEISIISRSGRSVRVSEHSPIYTVLKNHNHPVFRLVVDAARKGRRLDLVWHGPAGFLFLEREEGRSTLVAVSSSTTQRAWIHDASRLPQRRGLARAMISDEADATYRFILDFLIRDGGERRRDVLAPIDLVDPSGDPYRAVVIGLGLDATGWTASLRLSIPKTGDTPERVVIGRADGAALEAEALAPTGELCGNEPFFTAESVASEAGRLDILRAAAGERDVWEGRFRLCRTPRLRFREIP